MYNPYQNPGMFMTPQYGDPYQNRYQQMQMMQQSQTMPVAQQPAPTSKPATLNGRFINDPSEIMPSEIPMDGTPSIFVAKDSSYIYMKAWSADGTIKTVVFRPVETAPVSSDSQSNGNEDVMTAIMARFDKLEKMVSRNNYKPKNHQNQNQNSEGNDVNG